LVIPLYLNTGGEDMNALTGKWGEECGGVRAEGIEDE